MGHWGKIVFKADVGQDKSNLVNVIFFISMEQITNKNNLFEHMGVEMRSQSDFLDYGPKLLAL